MQACQASYNALLCVFAALVALAVAVSIRVLPWLLPRRRATDSVLLHTGAVLVISHLANFTPAIAAPPLYG